MTQGNEWTLEHVRGIGGGNAREQAGSTGPSQESGQFSKNHMCSSLPNNELINMFVWVG